MSVWFAVVASMSFMYMMSPCFEFSKTGKIICAIIHAISLIGGMIYDSNINDKVKKLEKDIKELKENKQYGND